MATAEELDAAYRISVEDERDDGRNLASHYVEALKLRADQGFVDPFREWRRVRVCNVPLSWNREKVRRFFAACLAPRHPEAAVLRVDAQKDWAGTFFVEFATRALARAVLRPEHLRGLQRVRPICPGERVTDVYALKGLRLEKPRAAVGDPPRELEEEEAAGELGIVTTGLKFDEPRPAISPAPLDAPPDAKRARDAAADAREPPPPRSAAAADASAAATAAADAAKAAADMQDFVRQHFELFLERFKAEIKNWHAPHVAAPAAPAAAAAAATSPAAAEHAKARLVEGGSPATPAENPATGDKRPRE